MKEDTIWKAEQVAEYLQVSVHTIRNDAEKKWPGFPKAIRIGRPQRWWASDVVEWVEEQRRVA